MFSISYTTLALVATLLHTTTEASPSAFASKRPGAPYTNSSKYSLVEDYSYPSFFDGFTLYDEADPTNGYISYVNYRTAKTNELIGWVYREETQSSTASIFVDAVGIAATGRQSVRLISTQNFTVGTLAVIDVLHQPVGAGPAGAGLWPAVWFLGAEGTWPYSGEIDVIEYVNPTRGSVNGSGAYNSMTLHTGPGCTVDKAPGQYGGSLQSTNCSYTDSGILGSNGCSVHAPVDNQVNGTYLATAGPAFNAQGGGVYIMSWTAEGISMWLFPRSALPSDLKSGSPDPSSWTQKPLAKFCGSGCDFTTAFTPQKLIINIDICGDWAGKVYPGGNNACIAFAKSHPQAYKDAYFEFGSIKIYNSS